MRSGSSEENPAVEHRHHLAPDHSTPGGRPETFFRRCVSTLSADRRLQVSASSLARSLRFTVRCALVTTLARRGDKAQRLNAAALPAPLNGAPRPLPAGRRQGALGSARNGERLDAAPCGASGEAPGRNALLNAARCIRGLGIAPPGKVRAQGKQGTPVTPKPNRSRPCVPAGPDPRRLRPS